MRVPATRKTESRVGAGVLPAVMDAADGVYLVFDEAVQSAEMADAIELRRQGEILEGETSRVGGSVLKWHSMSTDLGGNFHLGGQYSLSVVGVEDLAGNAAEVGAMSFTHATESVPMGESAYGVTTLFQGRTWHGDLGMYYYRARWYLPEGGVFGERDPVGYGDGQSVYGAFLSSPANRLDPSGFSALTKKEKLIIQNEFVPYFETRNKLLEFLNGVVSKEPVFGAVLLTPYLPDRKHVEFGGALVWRYYFKSSSGEMKFRDVTQYGDYSLKSDTLAFNLGDGDSIEWSVLILAHETAHRQKYLAFGLPNDELRLETYNEDQERFAWFVTYEFARWLIREGAARSEQPTDARDTVARLGPSGHFESELFKRKYGADYQGKLSKDFRGYRFDHLERIDKDGHQRVPFRDGPWEEIPEVE